MKVLVTPRSFAKTDPTPQAMLEGAGLTVVRNPGEKPLEEDDLIRLLSGVDGVIVGVDRLTARVIQAADSLQAISKYGVGVDNIALAAATERGIPVTITPGANTTSVAELTVGLMLAAARRIPFADRLVRGGSWGQVVGRELCGQTLGLVGMGMIGREVAKRAAAFGMKIVAFDQRQDAAFAAEHRVEYTGLDDLLSRSDFVSIHLPLTESTRGLIGEKALARMKRDAILVNTARGGIVDEAALARALKNEVIGGAALDVFAAEPAVGEELRGLPNVVLTPHMGGHTAEAVSNMGRQAAKNLLDVLRGVPDPDVVVNRDALKNREGPK
jgi:D-3-phosphoglycerate dehydrogenase